MTKVDYKKVHKDLYQPSAKEVSEVQVPDLNFLMVDGQGDPNNSIVFDQAVEALYGVSYGIKMLPKKGVVPEGYFDYVVPPLEGLWWVSHGLFDFDIRDNWVWTLMIRQPEFVTPDLVAETVVSVQQKKGSPMAGKVRLETYCEGLAVQMMHLGPYSEEPITVAKMSQYMIEKGYEISGRHHEIYLGDPRKTQPEKLRTVLRYPVTRL